MVLKSDVVHEETLWKRWINYQAYFLIFLCRKLIVPQKEPSPLLDRKIEELEAKFADMTDEELEDLGDDDGELGDQSLPQIQSSMSSDMDIMPYTPPQVRLAIFNYTCKIK